MSCLGEKSEENTALHISYGVFLVHTNPRWAECKCHSHRTLRSIPKQSSTTQSHSTTTLLSEIYQVSRPRDVHIPNRSKGTTSSRALLHTFITLQRLVHQSLQSWRRCWPGNHTAEIRSHQSRRNTWRCVQCTGCSTYQGNDVSTKNDIATRWQTPHHHDILLDWPITSRFICRTVTSPSWHSSSHPGAGIVLPFDTGRTRRKRVLSSSHEPMIPSVLYVYGHWSAVFNPPARSSPGSQAWGPFLTRIPSMLNASVYTFLSLALKDIRCERCILPDDRYELIERGAYHLRSSDTGGISWCVASSFCSSLVKNGHQCLVHGERSYEREGTRSAVCLMSKYTLVMRGKQPT